MGKRLTCPRCGASNEYDVPPNEVIATLRQVPCRGCGHRFEYGFKPEYVTEAESEIREHRAPDEPYDSSAEPVIARDRLTRYVTQHRDYHDRDRDVLLLHLLDCMEHVDGELTAIKRTLEVLKQRGR